MNKFFLSLVYYELQKLKIQKVTFQHSARLIPCIYGTSRFAELLPHSIKGNHDIVVITSHLNHLSSRFLPI